MPLFPEFPNDLVSRGFFSTQNNPGVISEDGYYEKIDVLRPLTIDVGSGVRKIRVKEMSFHGWGIIPPNIESSTIIINGSGVLELYIEDKFVFSGSSSLNCNGDSGQVMIYYRGDNNINISGDAKAFCCFFSNSLNSKFYLNGSGGINGAFFTKGNVVDITGGSSAVVTVIYAPNAHAKVHGGHIDNVKGAIVCNSFEAEGGAGITFHPGVNDIWVDVPEVEFESEAGESGEESSTVYRYQDRYWSD